MNTPAARLYEVLFVCTHNSARSVMAEGMLNHLGRGGFRAHSAGSQPSGKVHPQALATLQRMHIPTDGFRSKDWAEFSGPGAPALGFVFLAAATVLRRRIELMLALPLASLDPLAIQREISAIGQR